MTIPRAHAQPEVDGRRRVDGRSSKVTASLNADSEVDCSILDLPDCALLTIGQTSRLRAIVHIHALDACCFVNTRMQSTMQLYIVVNRDTSELLKVNKDEPNQTDENVTSVHQSVMVCNLAETAAAAAAAAATALISGIVGSEGRQRLDVE